MRQFIFLLAFVFATQAQAQSQTQVQSPGNIPGPVDQLLAALKSAPDEAAAATLETRIEHIWLEAGSPAVNLLMIKGMREMHAGAPAEAEEDFAAALTLDPGYAEAWRRRAIARFDSGDTNGAIADIGEVLQREPRNFAALDTLTRLSEALQDWRGAYAAWQKKLEIDPKTPGGEAKLKDLKRRALGDDT